MIFTFEALNAKKGDSLILTWGAPDKLRHLVIDGGPEGVWKQSLLPRLLELREGHELEDDEPLPLEMVMISHIDDDHINGILDLLREIERTSPAAAYRIKTLWHNSFDEIIGNGPAEMKSRLASLENEVDEISDRIDHSRAIVASVGQGRKLRAAAQGLHILLNGGFVGLVMAKRKRVTAPIAGDLKFHIIGPSEDRLQALMAAWEKDVKKNPSTASVASFVDKSVANLSSIVVVAEFAGKTMLLTGDARGDDILAGLENAGFIDDGDTGTCHFDVLKMPHHGSDRNMTEDFLRRITADHYIFSADGEHDNPDRGTIDMLGVARKGHSFLAHFTNETMKNKAGKDIGKTVKAALNKHGIAGMARFRAKNELGIRVDLLDPLPF